MPLRTFPLFLAVIVAGGLCAPARAQNPRLSLRLNGVTGFEAMQALSKASGVSLE